MESNCGYTDSHILHCSGLSICFLFPLQSVKGSEHLLCLLCSSSSSSSCSPVSCVNGGNRKAIWLRPRRRQKLTENICRKRGRRDTGPESHSVVQRSKSFVAHQGILAGMLSAGTSFWLKGRAALSTRMFPRQPF